VSPKVHRLKKHFYWEFLGGIPLEFESYTLIVPRILQTLRLGKRYVFHFSGRSNLNVNLYPKVSPIGFKKHFYWEFLRGIPLEFEP